MHIVSMCFSVPIGSASRIRVRCDLEKMVRRRSKYWSHSSTLNSRLSYRQELQAITFMTGCRLTTYRLGAPCPVIDNI